MIVETLLPGARERLVTVGENARLAVAAHRLGRREIGLLVVCNAADRMVGVVSRTDIVARIGHCAGRSCEMPVAAVMTRDVTSCHPGDDLSRLWAKLKTDSLSSVPVVDRDRYPLGVLCARDILQALMSETEHEDRLLKDYVMGIGYR